jgi:hypothetical protein
MTTTLGSRYAHWVEEGTRLAGGLTDLTQRATVYRQLFRDSGGNHVFPLIAAHGALWAKGYFRQQLRLGWWLALTDLWRPAARERRLAGLEALANALRDVNRRVCIDTYAKFHFTAEHGRDPGAAEFVPADTLAALNALHDAQRRGEDLPLWGQRRLFEAHFLSEQQTVVGPALDAALAQFDWPLVRGLAMRPQIEFAYFPAGERLLFRDFGSRDERIANGRRAFNIGAALGWRFVEDRLAVYGLLPQRFFSEPEANYAAVRLAALG